MSGLPMLASPSTGASNRTPISVESLAGTHVFDVKLDGIRAFARWSDDGGTFTLVNRNGVDITRKYPDLEVPALASPLHGMWLDGEIVALDGRFNTVLTRDKQASAQGIVAAAVRSPVKFYAFDLPDMAAQPWTERRRSLEGLDLSGLPFERTITSYDPGFLAQARDLGLEGVIAKRTTSTYQFGARSRSWLKFKNLHRVTCLVSGYEPGTGSRAHFGAMTLALIDPDGELVSAGRVGTGMSTREVTDLKGRLDRGEILTVEIECLGVTSGSVLRMPVYCGIRSDVVVLAASTAQLDAIPRS